MHVLLDGDKFSNSSPGLGLIVTLSEWESDCVVVVGHCGAVASHSKSKLSPFHFPKPDWSATCQAVREHFPAGCEGVRGVWVRGEEVEATAYLEKLVRTLYEKTDIKDVLTGEAFIVVAVATQDGQPNVVKCYLVNSVNPVSLQCAQIASQPVDDFLAQKTTTVRLQACIELTAARTKLSEQITFHAEQAHSNSYFLPSQSTIFDEHRLRDTLLSKALNLPSSKSRKKTTPSSSSPSSLDTTPAPVELLTCASDISKEKDEEEEGRLVAAPVLQLSRAVCKACVQLEVPVDVVGLFPLEAPLHSVASALSCSVAARLKAVDRAVHWKGGSVCAVGVHHFVLPSQHCPITVHYPHITLEGAELTDEKLRPLREKLHTLFDLPMDRPFIRTINRHFPARNTIGDRLINPHTAVKHKNGSLALVQGCYAYHHYMQDRFNDDGWGCAYRSLQTLWSWFVLQGYTSLAVPSHAAIQQTLVDVGDKEASLVGSKQWIGSFEVSTCLNHRLGVLSRIQHCSRGSEMGGVGRALLHHFRTHGTPVMIGGGVLAHTILGVDFSETTGEIRFLILDPHYTGRDDIKTVVDKGWCGWKPVGFWDPVAHYNLCMPQRPPDAI